VIRVGGNVSDYSTYDANGTPKNLPKDTVLTRENFRQLRTFLDATGWKLIWGLNLGTGKLDNMVEEARAVADAVGDKLIAFEVGNEPDLFGHAGHRQGNYDYAAWHTEFRRYKSAIRACVAARPFRGPRHRHALAGLDAVLRQGRSGRPSPSHRASLHHRPGQSRLNYPIHAGGREKVPAGTVQIPIHFPRRAHPLADVRDRLFLRRRQGGGQR
jgi:hypothetical protein